MTQHIIAPDPPGPYVQFHEARMMLSGHFLGIVMGAIPLGFLLYLLATAGLPARDPEWFFYGLLAVCGVPMSWLYAQTLARMAQGEAAGIQISEEDDHVEIVFFAGKTPCWQQLYRYSEIIDHGVAEFPAGPSTQTMPFVATPGHLFGSTKQPIPLAALCDLRRFHPIYQQVLAADISRIRSRHPAA